MKITKTIVRNPAEIGSGCLPAEYKSQCLCANHLVAKEEVKAALSLNLTG
jgi:hypothetical protein